MKKNNKKMLIGPMFCVGMLVAPGLSAHSLSQAVQLALTHNPEVLSAKQGVGVATEQLDQAKAGWMPTVDLAVDMGYEYNNKSSTDSTMMGKNISSLILNQPLFDGGATSASVARNGHMQQVSAIHFDEIRTNVALKAIETWYELFKLQRVIKLTEENVNEHRVFYFQVKQKVAAGGAGEMELVAAETPWLTAQSALINARGDYQDALARYQSVVGVEPGESLKSGLDISDAQLPHDLNEATELLILNSFILRTARENLLASKADYKGARAGLLPTLNFELKGGRKENEGGVEGADLDASALVKLKYNLFRGGSDESKRREMARTVLDSQEQFLLAQRNMVEQLSQYWNGLDVSRKLMATSHQQLRLARDNHESAKEQFKLGEGDVKAIMAAADAVLMAKKSVLDDEIDVHLGRFRLLAHIGLLLHHVKASDVMLVMEQIQEVEVESVAPWVDRIVHKIGSEPLLDAPQSVSVAPVVSQVMAVAPLLVGGGQVVEPPVRRAEGGVDAGWKETYSSMRDAGWVVFNAMDQVEGVEVAHEGAGRHVVAANAKAPAANMTLVGGDVSNSSTLYQRNRSELRRMELQRRLGWYGRQSGQYKRRLEKQQMKLGLRREALQSVESQYNRRVAMRNFAVQ